MFSNSIVLARNTMLMVPYMTCKLESFTVRDVIKLPVYYVRSKYVQLSVGHCGEFGIVSFAHFYGFTGRLPCQPAGIKFTHCVSGHKSAFSPLQEKLCVGSKNDSHLFELSRRSLSACKVWGRLNYVRRL